MKLSALILILLLPHPTSCAPGPNPMKGTPTGKNSVAGFWLGLWQGFIAPFVFVISLFKSGLNIYEVHNRSLVQLRIPVRPDVLLRRRRPPVATPTIALECGPPPWFSNVR